MSQLLTVRSPHGARTEYRSLHSEKLRRWTQSGMAKAFQWRQRTLSSFFILVSASSLLAWCVDCGTMALQCSTYHNVDYSTLRNLHSAMSEERSTRASLRGSVLPRTLNLQADNRLPFDKEGRKCDTNETHSRTRATYMTDASHGYSQLTT